MQEEWLCSLHYRGPWVSSLTNLVRSLQLTFPRNAEEMLNEKGTTKTSHTTNKVPFILANVPEGWSLKDDSENVLGDVAPTVLATLGIDQPEEMSGKSLLVKS